MELVTKKLSEIKPYPNNPRVNDKAVDAVVKSIKQCEYIAPIVVDEDMVILAGHTRLRALQLLGRKKAEVIVREGLSDTQKKKYRLLDNKTGELADWDLEMLEKELEDLDFEDLDLDWELDDPTRNYPDFTPGSLIDKFIIPPFSVLDGRKGEWLDRKRTWRELIGDNGEARDDVELIELSRGGNYNAMSMLDPVVSELACRWFLPDIETPKCLDVFAGDTVFGFVCGYLGNDFTGIELRQEQADFNQSRVDEFGLKARYICDDGRNVRKHIDDDSMDLLFSCPPYFDLEVYSDLENDASNQKDYESFYEIVDTAFSEAIHCLKDNRFAVIVAGEVRSKKDGHYYGFLEDIKDTFKREGMAFLNEIILLDPYGTAPIRATRYMKFRKVAKVHQNILVFYKGNPNKVPDYFAPIIVDPDEVEWYASEDV